ncbi:hypothetical protein R3P38DRAFT_3177676 [Favolaschia claudopus]|uniref:F-box domain-containing protein n=1 Tax=Favolaschia claudopus TaxID=2862362 RepID=A0AAW0CTZ2_9AGAR
MNSTVDCSGCPCHPHHTSSLLPTDAEISRMKHFSRFGILPPQPSVLKAKISAIPPELERYDATIQQLGTEMLRMASERRSLASYAASCRNALAPIHRLPNEILANIFASCMPHELFDVVDPIGITPEQEVDGISHWHLLQLAKVCARWHRVAMGTPQLWSSIAVRTDLWSECGISPETLLALVEAALDRGQNCPLNLMIRASEHVESILELVTRHAHRWQAVNLLNVDHGDLVRHLSNLAGKLDRLTQLSFVVADLGEVDVFLKAPRLTRIVFYGSVNPAPEMPWGQIQCCNYIGDKTTKTTNSPYYPLNLLLLTPKMESFIFRLDLCECPPDEHWNVDISSDLRCIDFRISADTVDTIGQLFDSLTLPCLATFAVTPLEEMEPPMWHTERFLSLADRSDFSHHLTSLAIHAIITDAELLRCLRVLPMLQTLSISDFISIGANDSSPVITDILLQALTYHTDAPSLIPHLEYVHLISHLEFTDAAFIDFIKSRVKRVWESKDVTFEPILGWYWRPKGDMSGEILDRLHNLQETIADWKGEILGHTEIS